MQSNPKSNSIITSKYDAEANVITFTVLGHGDVALDLNKVHADNLARAAIHGFNQRIPDSAAIGTADVGGKPIPKAERTRIKFERMNDLCRHYESGTAEWSRKGDGLGALPALGVAVFARANDCTLESAKERIEARAKAAGRTYAKQLNVVLQLFPAEAAAIRAERASRVTPAFDSDAEMSAMRNEAE